MALSAARKAELAAGNPDADMLAVLDNAGPVYVQILADGVATTPEIRDTYGNVTAGWKALGGTLTDEA